MSTHWDPGQYARFSDERSRPFRDLLARVWHPAPSLVVDLGCGNGPLTLALADRWPGARVVGADSSAQMLEAATALDRYHRVEWVQADVARWDLRSLGEAPDVLVSNATLQWVPQHLPLLERWAGALAPDGWLAVQLPGNHDAPSHELMRAAAADHPRAAELLPALARPAVAEPATYLRVLSARRLQVDAWETTYLHVLDRHGTQESPVLEWVRSTGLRPVLEILAEGREREAFLADYDARLRAAYRREPFGTLFPFRRIFAVAHRVDEGSS